MLMVMIRFDQVMIVDQHYLLDNDDDYHYFRGQWFFFCCIQLGIAQEIFFFFKFLYLNNSGCLNWCWFDLNFFLFGQIRVRVASISFYFFVWTIIIIIIKHYSTSGDSFFCFVQKSHWEPKMKLEREKKRKLFHSKIIIHTTTTTTTTLQN